MFKGFDCNNTLLIIPGSKYGSTPGEYPYGRLSPSEMASLSFTGPVPLTLPPATDYMINAISTSPYWLSSLPPSMISNFLNSLISSPLYLQSVKPSIIISLIDTLCSSTSLLKVTPDRTLVDLITAIALYPKFINALPPSLTVCLLNKIHAKNILCSLSPAVRVTIMHSLLSPEALKTLKPTEISFLINIYQSTKCLLSESSPADPIELLKTIASSASLMDNIPISQIISFLHQISKLAPSLVGTIPPNVTNALFASFVKSIHNQCPSTLLELTRVITSSPYMFNTIDPSILSSLLLALSQPHVLSTIPPTVIIKLLTDLSLSKTILKSIKPETIINVLYAIKSVSPKLLIDIPSSVRSAYLLYFTDVEVIGALTVQISFKLIDILCNTPNFLSLLPSKSINQIITFIVSNESLLNEIPLKNIVDFFYNITILSPFILKEIPIENIQKLLSQLTTTNALSSLSSSYYEKLLYSLAYSPFLMDVILDTQITSILNTLNLSADVFNKIPSNIYINILTEIFTLPKLLSKIPLALLLNFMQKINDLTPNSLLCTISPSAISAFIDFLEKEPAKLISMSQKDLTILINILVKLPCFLTQISVKTINVLFDSITASSTILDAIPIEIKIKFIYSIYSLSPAIFCSLSPKSISDITNSFNSFNTLSSLSSDSLVNLTTVISECPCFLSAMDSKTVTNLLDVLSNTPSILNTLKPPIIINLISSISSNETLSATIPIHSYIRFLQALSINVPSTLCFIPTSVYAILLNPLKSLKVMKTLTSADFENIVDMLTATPCLLAELPQNTLVNLLTAISETFTNLSYTKTIVLLASIHSISPSLLCIVPRNVLTELLKTFSSQSELNSLPSEYVVALTAVLSSSPCLLNSMPVSTLDRVLRLLLSPSTKSPIPSYMLVNFLTKLSLSPSIRKDVQFPLIVAILSTLSRSSAFALLPVVAHALLASSGNPKTIYELRPNEVVSFISVAVSTPSLLKTLAGPTLNNLMIKVASSSHLLTYVSPSLLTSFISALTSSPAAFSTVQPTTIVNLMTSVALRQPLVLSTLPSSVASTLLDAFNSPNIFASLPPPTINSFINLLLAFPNLFMALPISTLNSLLSFLSASPTVLGALPTCTLVKFLTVLSSLPSLLGTISPCLITAFLSALSAASPKFLCVLPPSVVTTFVSTVTSSPALASATPSSIASLISTLNRSSCLISVLPVSVLVSFLTYLTSHANLLNETPRPELVTLIENVRSIRRVVINDQQHPNNVFDDFASFQIPSPISNHANDEVKSRKIAPKMIQPIDVNGTTVYVFPWVSEQNDSVENLSDNISKNPIDLIPKLVLPEHSRGADVYILPTNNNRSSSDDNTET